MARQLLLNGFRSGGTYSVLQTIPHGTKRIKRFRRQKLLKESLLLDEGSETDNSCNPHAILNFSELPCRKKKNGGK